jgi:hypothetical protein
MAIQHSLIKGWPKRTLAIVSILVGGLAAGTPLAAAEKSGAAGSLFDSKYTLILGGFFPRIGGTISLNSPRGRGTDISMEDDLGLNDGTSTVWLGFNWRFQPRHQFQAEWFQLDRKGSTIAGRDFTFFDTTVGVGASLDSKIDLNLGRLTYGYSILRDDNLDLAFLVGVHITTVKATITAAGNVSVNGVPVVGRSVTVSTARKTLPLPHLGGSLAYEFTPKLAGKLTVLAFALDVGEYSGSLLEFDAFMAYQLSKRFGIGGGLKYFNLNVQYDKSGGGKAKYDYEFFGPALFGYASF